MKNNIISLSKINLIYTDSGGNRFNALSDIELDIEAGEYLAILGTSGSGKTTLSNVIGMLNGEFTGEYLFNGIDGGTLSSGKRGEIRGDDFGFIFQDYVLLDYLTALENVALALHYSNLPKKEIYKLASEKLKNVGLEGKEDHYPRQLSGGQKQRVSIARALIKNPKVIIADEPTGALDHQSRIEVLSILQDLNQQGVTIITVTHSDEDARAAKRVIRIEKGRIVSDLWQRNRERFFGRLTDVTHPVQVAIRKKMILEYVNLNYGIQSQDFFLYLAKSECTSEMKVKLLSQTKTEWLKDDEMKYYLNQWFIRSEDLIQLLISIIVLKAESESEFLGTNELVALSNDFLSREWDEETSLYFLNNISSTSGKIFKKKLNFHYFFEHPSDKVRIRSRRFFKTKDYLDQTDIDSFLSIILSDPVHIVRSNMLDFLYTLDDFDFKKLLVFNFAQDPSSRVRAIWAEILFRLNDHQKAVEIYNEMFASHDLSAVLASVWVFAKDKEFNIVKFLDERIEVNPHLVNFIDDILTTFNRVQRELTDWRKKQQDLADEELSDE